MNALSPRSHLSESMRGIDQNGPSFQRPEYYTDGYKKRIKRKPTKREVLRLSIAAVMVSNPGKVMENSIVWGKIGSKSDRGAVTAELGRMADEGLLIRVRSGQYQSTDRLQNEHGDLVSQDHVVASGQVPRSVSVPKSPRKVSKPVADYDTTRLISVLDLAWPGWKSVSSDDMVRADVLAKVKAGFKRTLALIPEPDSQ